MFKANHWSADRSVLFAYCGRSELGTVGSQPKIGVQMISRRRTHQVAFRLAHTDAGSLDHGEHGTQLSGQHGILKQHKVAWPAHLLKVPLFVYWIQTDNLSEIGPFSFTGPTVWNSLPLGIHSTYSTPAITEALKTDLLRVTSYPAKSSHYSIHILIIMHFTCSHYL